MSISIAIMLQVSVQTGAVPFHGEATVSGIVDDMWIESDHCCFRISIYWSDNDNLDGDLVIAIALFLNELTGKHEETTSSQGWMAGDEVNATLAYTYDEFGETYWIELSSKSDENYAEPLSYFERNPFIFYLFLIIVLYVALQSMLLLVFKRRGKRGKVITPDYIRCRRRI